MDQHIVEVEFASGYRFVHEHNTVELAQADFDAIKDDMSINYLYLEVATYRRTGTTVKKVTHDVDAR